MLALGTCVGPPRWVGATLTTNLYLPQGGSDEWTPSHGRQVGMEIPNRESADPMTRNGPDRRGNSRDRYQRKTWLLRQFGDGHTCPCMHCSRSLTRKTLEADRIVPGGSYRHANILPSCRDCNTKRGNTPLERFHDNLDKRELVK